MCMCVRLYSWIVLSTSVLAKMLTMMDGSSVMDDDEGRSQDRARTADVIRSARCTALLSLEFNG